MSAIKSSATPYRYVYPPTPPDEVYIDFAAAVQQQRDQSLYPPTRRSLHDGRAPAHRGNQPRDAFELGLGATPRYLRTQVAARPPERSTLAHVVMSLRPEECTAFILPMMLSMPMASGLVLFDLADARDAPTRTRAIASLSGMFAGFAVGATLSTLAIALSRAFASVMGLRPRRSACAAWLLAVLGAAGCTTGAALALREWEAPVATKVGTSIAAAGIGCVCGHFAHLACRGVVAARRP